MARFVIDPGATLELASAAVEIPPDRELYAPTLSRAANVSTDAAFLERVADLVPTAPVDVLR